MEQEIDKRSKLLSQIDSLERSRKFFKLEFNGDEGDREGYLAEIDAKLKCFNDELAISAAPQPIGPLHRGFPSECERGLKLLINDLRLFFQVDNMITSDGIVALCPLIIGEYADLSLEEITVCFALAKKGYFGEVYNRLDGQVILKWIRVYNKERLDRLLRKSEEVHWQSRSDICYREKAASNSELLNIAYAAREIESLKGNI